MNGRNRIVVFVSAAVLLAACQTLGGAQFVLLKSGSTLEQRRAVIDACQVKALQEVPPAYQTTSFGGYGGFGPSYCYGYGCRFSGGAYPQVMSIDPNEALRARRFDACLRSEGYTVARKPLCTDQGSANAYRAQFRQPPAAQVSCVAGEPALQSRWIPR